jgi:hypothetical protein
VADLFSLVPNTVVLLFATALVQMFEVKKLAFVLFRTKLHNHYYIAAHWTADGLWITADVGMWLGWIRWRRSTILLESY